MFVVGRSESSLPLVGLRTAGCTGRAAGWLISTPASHHSIRSSIKTLTKRSPLTRVYVYTELKLPSPLTRKDTDNVCCLLRWLNGFMESIYADARSCPSGPVSDLVKVTAFITLFHCFCGHCLAFESQRKQLKTSHKNETSKDRSVIRLAFMQDEPKGGKQPFSFITSQKLSWKQKCPG